MVQLGPSEKSAPILSVRREPPGGFSVLRILPARISKTVSFSVYFRTYAARFW